MALTKIHSNLGEPYTKAMIRVNPTLYQFVNSSLSGVNPLGVSGINHKYDRPNPPFTLGSGVNVNTAGRFLLNNAYEEPVALFEVRNLGNETIYAGINAVASGQWGLGSGQAIPSGQTFEFGAEGTQVIRNVWAMTAQNSSTVTGGATNLLNWV